MRKTAILVLTALLAATSCEYEFDVTPVDTTPKMYVESLPGLGDDCLFKIYKSVPVGSASSTEGNDYTVRRISFTINGKGADLYPAGDGLWKSKKTLKPGDELSFELETMETPKVKAETSIPEVPVFSCTVTKMKSDLIDMLNFAVQFEDVDIKEDDYYGLDARCKLSSKTDPEDVEIYRQDAFVPGSVSVSYDLTGDGYAEDLLIISGKDIIEGRYNYITYLSEYDLDSFDYSYSLSVYHLSKEAYGFLFSEYNKNANLMAAIGLCPPNFSYTNIHGGYGVMGGVSCASTPFQQVEIN